MEKSLAERIISDLKFAYDKNMGCKLTNKQIKALVDYIEQLQLDLEATRALINDVY